MKAACVLLVLAALVCAVTAQPAVPAVDEYTPAIMTKPAATLKKPIIFAPAPAGGVDVNSPLFGAPPAGLKKANISENIYGGVVEFAKGRDARGCRCRKQLPEKFRYDAQFKKERKVVGPCGCPIVAPKPEDKLPPVIARLYPIRANTTNTTAPCPKPAEPVVVKIAPKYYPKRKGPRALAAEAAKLAACLKPAPAAPVHITPKFYPTPAERRARRKARRAARLAAAAAKKKL
jgi:hypothetical protein